MDSSLVEELMLENFPAVWPEDHEWINVHDGKEPKRAVIREMLTRVSSTPELLVMAEGGIAGSFSAAQAEEVIARQVLRSQVQVANLDFTQLMFVQINGVAAVWPHSDGLASGE